ncbi:MAG: VOC family protein [Candidatus Omnitrophota bacterium]
MIKVKGIDHVAITCVDLERSRKFYTETLGLEMTRREHQKPGAEYFLDCGASLIGLMQGDPKGEKHLLQDEGIGANHVAFQVSSKDFDRIVGELKEKNVPIHFSKKRERSWSVYFSDPDGNKLEITAWPKED